MEHIFKQLKESWIVLVLFFSIIVWYAGTNARLTQAETDIKDLKNAVGEITDMKIQIERIDTSVQFIKERVK